MAECCDAEIQRLAKLAPPACRPMYAGDFTRCSFEHSNYQMRDASKRIVDGARNYYHGV